MRKLFSIIVGITAAFFLVTVVIAQEIESSPSAVSVPSPVSVEYFLPYPGLLPDNPLYSLKALRDKIVSILITDPVKQIEFNILMADKRLNMGIFLSEKGKEKLAQKTVLEAEKYFLSAAEQLELLVGKKQGLESLQDVMTRSIAKHKTVVTQLKDKSVPEYQEGYREIMSLIEKSQKKLQGI